MPKKDARTLVARFNEQIEPIYALLRETEDVNLAYEILEPEPTEIPALKQRWERTWSSLAALLPCSAFNCSVRLPQSLCSVWLLWGLSCSAPTMQATEYVVYKETKGHKHFLLNTADDYSGQPPAYSFLRGGVLELPPTCCVLQMICIPNSCPGI